MKLIPSLVWQALAALAFCAPLPPSARGDEKPKIAPTLQPFVDDHTLAGAVTLVGTKEKILDVEAVGWADIAGNKPMRGDTLFWIASQSKPILATAMMILVDEGKVKLEDPVSKYLPEYKDLWVETERDPKHIELKHPEHAILIRNLLTHTSGLVPKSPVEEPTVDLISLTTRTHAYPLLPLHFEPGSKYEYCNAGINTAGRIVEIVSGLPYEQFLSERIFKPLAMGDTTFWPSAAQLERLAKPYKANAAKTDLEEATITALHYPLSDRTRTPLPAGGLFSTATDLFHFYRMISNGGVYDGTRVLSEEAVKQMTTKQTNLPTDYGFGFSTGKRIGHGGAYNTSSTIDVSTGLIEIFLVQHQTWRDEGKKILPAFQAAATEVFAAKPEIK